MVSGSSDHQPRLLIYRLGSLGDTIVALPALRLIARSFPDAERWMLTNFSIGAKAAPMAEILDGTGLVHGYIEYPLGLRDLAGLMQLRRKILRLGFDRLVYLQEPRGTFNAFRDAAFFFGCGIRKLVGVPYRSECQRPRRIGSDRYEYVGARLLRCIGALGSLDLDEPGAFDLGLSPAEFEAADRAMASLVTDRIIIAASIGAKVDVKDWGDDNWSKLFATLSLTYPDAQLILVGVDVERARSEALAAHWAGPSLNLCGRLTVRETAAALARARLFLGHDSGPMHLAAAVGTPCFAIFSSRNLPGEWFPYGTNHRIFYRHISCQGCRMTVCHDRKKFCIQSIDADMIARAVQSFCRVSTDSRV